MKRGTKSSERRALTPRSRIFVKNRQRTVRLDVAPLQQFADRALTPAFLAAPNRNPMTGFPSEVFVWLISDRRMSFLHQQFMNEAGPTDVITFQHGEIFISVETARRQSRQFGTSTLREIELYIVHGILHLLGFDDHTTAQRSQMRAAETAVLRHARRLK